MISSPTRREFLRVVSAALACSSAGKAAPHLPFRYPFVQNVTRNRAIVRWGTAATGVGEVQFWDDSKELHKSPARVQYLAPQQTGSGSEHYSFEAILPKLNPGTTYFYRALVDGIPIHSENLQFRTPGTQPFQFLAFGDSGTGSPQQRQIANRLLTHDADFVLHTGDLVYPAGTYERYDALYFAYYKELMRDTPFFPCPGNHDYYEQSCLPYRVLNALPEETVSVPDHGRYYSFDWGNAHFVSLDTNEALENVANGTGEMLAWLDQDLAATTKYWKIIVMHHPAYSAGIHTMDVESDRVRQYLTPVIDKYSVPLVLNGHEHSYQRSFPIREAGVVPSGKGTIYLTTGGGGADLHPVYPSGWVDKAVSEFHYLNCSINGTKLKVQALTADGVELDSFSLSPTPSVARTEVVNAASFGPELAAGGLATIFGLHLAPDDVVSSQYPLPRSSGGTSLLINGQPLPILMVSPTQVNFQLPFDVTGDTTLTVRGMNGTVTVPLSVKDVAPALFTGALFNQAGTAISPDNPARAGDVLSVYLTGLGAAQGTLKLGDPSSGQAVDCKVQVELGGALQECRYAGLAPGMVGVNVVQFAVPGDIHGNQSLRVIAAGRASNAIIFRAA